MIGVIVKTDLSAEDLYESWVPDSFRIEDILAAFKELLGYEPKTLEFTHDNDFCLIHFEVDSQHEPKAITFSCTANKNEAKVLNSLATKLKAKIFDSESYEFVQL